jgi:hypothetical protein
MGTVNLLNDFGTQRLALGDTHIIPEAKGRDRRIGPAIGPIRLPCLYP